MPYAHHLLSVAGLVMGEGGTEDETIAALLHDALEDQGGLATAAAIRDRYGQHILDIVEGCSECYERPKPAWQQRKEIYLEKVRRGCPSILLVANADKLDNARSVLMDYHELGEDIWRRFHGGRSGTLWYYRQVREIFPQRRPSRISRQLERTVQDILDLAAQHEALPPKG